MLGAPLIPLDPPWAEVVARLHRHFGSYDKLLDAMGTQGCNPCDHSQLSRLQSGKCRRPTWQAGGGVAESVRAAKGRLMAVDEKTLQMVAALLAASYPPKRTPKQEAIVNALAMQYSRPPERNWLNEPLPMEGRFNLLPIRESQPGMGPSLFNKRELALPGFLAGAVNAFTAPGRAAEGLLADPKDEALNFAGTFMGGGLLGSRAVPPPSGSIGMNMMRLFRAHVKDDLGKIKKFTSWSPDEDVAIAYTDNPGFGGPNVRSVDLPNDLNILDVGDIHSYSGKKRLAEALGFDDPGDVAQTWQDAGYRYPWEESSAVKRELEASGYDLIRYEDDFPDGARTVVALRDFVLPQK